MPKKKAGGKGKGKKKAPPAGEDLASDEEEVPMGLETEDDTDMKALNKAFIKVWRSILFSVPD